jgi:hypothetical protein
MKKQTVGLAATADSLEAVFSTVFVIAFICDIFNL